MLRPRVVGATNFGGWGLREDPLRVGRYFLDHRRDGLRVIISGARYGDGRRWVHLSCSHRERLPSWEELKAVRSRFLGDDALALQVFPPKAQWVNVHPNVLHLWRCVDGDPVPDFRDVIGRLVSL